MTPPELTTENDQTWAIRPSLAGDGKAAMQSVPRTTDTKSIPVEANKPKISPPIDGTAKDASPHSLGGGRFLRESLGQSWGGRRSASQSPFRLAMPALSPAQLAFSAMQYLPIPVMILNNLKTVVQANEAMAKMLDLVPEHTDDEPSTAMEHLRGQTLSQVGIDMLQDGRPVWLTWETFFDSLVEELGVKAATAESRREAHTNTGDATPTSANLPSADERGSTGQEPQNAVVEVVISRRSIGNVGRERNSNRSDHQILAKMIISIWEIEERQPFFTLTFTSNQSSPSSLVQTKKSIARPSFLEAADKRTITNSNSSSVTSSRDSNSPSFHSPGIVTMSSSTFPPNGPPTLASRSSTPSLLQKMMLIKDALLDNTEMPILAMWKDGSAVFPNKAARKLFGDTEGASSSDGFGLLRQWRCWNEDFTQEMDAEDMPISQLIRTETPFANMRVGMYNAEGNKVVYDVLGEAIRDDTTGEFLAGVVTARDVTDMSEEIIQIKEWDEEREEHFRLICDTMPQMVWTATPEGYHDYFNSGWYEYTGLTPEQSLGDGWQTPFHADDLAEARPRWLHALKTGESYEVEYRCRNKDGEWRWFLGRAAAARNKETGEVEKWFGTCTDVHGGVQTKMEAARTREQLLSVLTHSKVTMFTVDTERRVTLLEGSLIWDKAEELSKSKRWYIGQNMYTVFNRLTEQLPEGERPEFLQPIEDILDGKITEGIREHQLDDQSYRTRFIPFKQKEKGASGTPGASADGVIGVIMDVTEIRQREEALKKQSEEKRRAMANEAAAKEATRLKSQFLANMSHEIRTPITGVLGMAELLGATELDDSQRDFVDNIQSSATSLLTVINDILDFSKVESGRLDIEEVQFSLSLIVKEVGKMLRFAVERKNLDFRSDIGGDIKNDMVVIGDPGRVRQIITNLLTNSIKFTNQGYVRFSVVKERETADSVEVRFTVEDTGIGIREDVRKRLFQPFSQGDASTARQFGGTGLGLTICKNLLELMRGRINLRSTLGKGTTATFWIPFHKSSSPQNTKTVEAGAIPDRLQSELSLSCNSSEHEQHASNSPVSGDGMTPSSGVRRRPSNRVSFDKEKELLPDERAKIHVLVVEDNAINQKYAIYAITKMGFQVKAVWNGKEALDYLTGVIENKNTKPDIILMDVQMPIIDGYKCTHLLRHHMPFKTLINDVAIVAMTASAIQGDREKALKAGMDDYLCKPVTREIIELMITRWATSGRRRAESPPDISTASDCSELSEHCGNADIPQVGIEDNAFIAGDIDDSDDFHNSPITPRPLTTTNGGQEISPFDSPHLHQQEQQPRNHEGEKEWAGQLQDNKLLDAAGGTAAVREGQTRPTWGRGERLTEENVSKLTEENEQPR